VCFIKSIRARYAIVPGYEYRRHGSEEKEMRSGKKSRKETYLNGLVNEEKIKFLVSTIQDKSRILRFIGDKLKSIVPSCEGIKSLENTGTFENIQSTYKQMSWHDTQLDFESVRWINNSMRILWPSIKSLVSKKLHETLQQSHAAASRKRRTRGPNLSFYLSCRRKLNFLRQQREKAQQMPFHRSTLRRFVMLTVAMLKITTLLLKQFILDQASNLWKTYRGNKSREKVAKNVQEEVKEKPIQIDIAELIAKSKALKIEVDPKALKEKLQRPGSLTTAPPTPPEKKLPPTSSLNRSLVRQGFVDLLKRKKREKLAEKLEEACRKYETPKKSEQMVAIIEKLNLGDRAPVIDAIKFIEPDSNILISDAFKTQRKLQPSDANTASFLVEVTFKSGDNFCVLLSSLPLLDKAQLSYFGFRFRLMISVNRSDCIHDPNIELFQQSDRKLDPIINGIDIALVDVPQLDWLVDTDSRGLAASGSAISKSPKRRRQVARETPGKKYESPLDRLKRRLTPTRLINHDHFKYLVHLFIYMVQRWFQPFDFKLGELICLRSLC